MKRFEDPPNTASIMCSHVLREKLPILFVAHDEEDGTWQFLCDVRDHDESNCTLVPLRTALDLDPTVTEVADLPHGYIATRKAHGRAWVREPDPYLDAEEED